MLITKTINEKHKDKKADKTPKTFSHKKYTNVLEKFVAHHFNHYKQYFC